MDETILRAEEVDEGAEIDGLHNLAVIDHTKLGLGDDVLDAGDSRLAGRAGHGRHLDGAVVIDVDLRTGGLADLADDLAARADDVTDLVDRNRHGRDLRRAVGKPVAGRGQRLGHLAKDMKTSVFRLVERDLHDFRRDRGDLDVHLQRGHTGFGTGHLEVHVAEMILVTENVRQHGEGIAFLDQAHRDAGHRTIQRNTGIHQRQRAATDGRHRGRAVRLGDLGDKADGVGEVLFLRQQRTKRTPCELAMADLAATRRADTASLTDRVGREVVVQHEVRTALADEGVDDLLVLAGAECGDNHRLGLAAGEQRRAVGARQESCLGNDLADRLGVAPVDTLAGLEDRAANDIGLFRLDQAADQNTVVILAQLFLGRRADLAESRLALGLVGNLVSGDELVAETVDDGLDLACLGRLLGKGARLLGAGFGKVDDRVDHRLHRVMAEGHGAEHHFLGQFLCLGLDHQHAFMRAGEDQVQRGLVHLRDGRVEDIFAIDPADASGGNRAEERNTRQAQGRRGADHRGDVGIVLHVMGQNGTDDLRLALEGGGEERPDRTVDQAADKGLVLGGTALALEEAARDLAGGERLFLIVDRQREEILARLRAVRRDGGTKNGGLAEADHHRAICLTGHLAGLEDERGAVPVKLFAEYLEHRYLSLFSS